MLIFILSDFENNCEGTLKYIFQLIYMYIFIYFINYLPRLKSCMLPAIHAMSIDAVNELCYITPVAKGIMLQ